MNPSALEQKIAESVAAFEAGTLPPKALDHRTHVQIAWWMLRSATPLDGLGRFDRAVQRYAVAIGKPDLYHATITWAFLLAITERLQARGRARSWDEFEHDERELFEKDFLRKRYREETLGSTLARSVFVWPDRAA